MRDLTPPSHLFSELQLRGLTLRNRIVVAPMATYQANCGFVGDWHLMHLGRFAAGGAGLVMMESSKIDPGGCATFHDVALWDDSFVPGLRRVTNLVHSQNAAIGIQLAHAGRKARVALPWEGRGSLPEEEWIQAEWDWTLVGPSAIAHGAGWPLPRALEVSEIQSLVHKWGEAAARADHAGFDIVEIHGAHGYLLHEFLSEAANQRTDAYGGSPEKRMRFLLEVIEEVRARWPAHKPLFVRISSEDEQGWTIEDSVPLAKELKLLGVDVIDCSSGGMGSGESILGGQDRRIGYGYQVDFADRIRRGADLATMAVGMIIHADQAEAILSAGQADLVALGREMLLNPNWPIDAAEKLGSAAALEQIPDTFSFWLANRRLERFGGKPSTWRAGI